MNKLLLLLMLTACGGDYVILGEVTVNHKIDLASEWFVEYCAAEYPNNEEAQRECVSEMIADFLSMMGNE